MLFHFPRRCYSSLSDCFSFSYPIQGWRLSLSLSANIWNKTKWILFFRQNESTARSGECSLKTIPTSPSRRKPALHGYADKWRIHCLKPRQFLFPTFTIRKKKVENEKKASKLKIETKLRKLYASMKHTLCKWDLHSMGFDVIWCVTCTSINKVPIIRRKKYTSSQYLISSYALDRTEQNRTEECIAEMTNTINKMSSEAGQYELV